jgi:tetratricopeptide (TPR) repeat protein
VEAGRYEDAVPLLRTAAAAAARRSGPAALETAIACNRLGVACKFAGRYDEAADAYARALPVAEAEAASDPSLLCTLLHNLGGLAHSRGDDPAAEPSARRGLALRESFCAPGDPAIAEDAAALGAILEGLERWDEAEGLYRRALAIWEGEEDSYEIGMTLNGLAAVVRFSGRPLEAEPLFRRALHLLEQERGDGHPDTATVRNNLAMLLNATGRAELALPLLDSALIDLEASVGAEHPATRDVRANRDRIADALARGGGLEPPMAGPEPAVLPITPPPNGRRPP